MANRSKKPIYIFYSYSHKDEMLRDKLEKHLSLLKRNGLIANWHDRKITAGKSLDHEISEHLERANIILLLVSADFLASDYCYDREMKRALEKHHLGETRVISIILRPCDWHSSPFGNLNALPKNGKPITTWKNQDQAFTNAAIEIRKVVEEISGVTQPQARRSSAKIPIRFRECDVIVGLGIDLSGSMAENIRNDTKNQISRFEGFGRALEGLAKNAHDGLIENRRQGMSTAIDIFAYGFGMRGIEVCDLLSLLKIGREVLSKEEIEQIKTQYLAEVNARYKGYEGTKELLNTLGIGALVENIVSANAEEEIRKRKVDPFVKTQFGSKLR